MRCCLLSPSFFVCPLKLPSSRTGLFLGLLYSGEHGRRVKKRESFFSGEKVFKCTFTKKRGLVLEARQWKRERACVGKGPGGCIKHGKQSFKIADCKCPTLASYFHLIFFPFFYCDPVSGTSSSLSKKKLAWVSMLGHQEAAECFWKNWLSSGAQCDQYRWLPTILDFPDVSWILSIAFCVHSLFCWVM